MTPTPSHSLLPALGVGAVRAHPGKEPEAVGVPWGPGPDGLGASARGCRRGQWASAPPPRAPRSHWTTPRFCELEFGKRFLPFMGCFPSLRSSCNPLTALQDSALPSNTFEALKPDPSKRCGPCISPRPPPSLRYNHPCAPSPAPAPGFAVRPREQGRVQKWMLPST